MKGRRYIYPALSLVLAIGCVGCGGTSSVNTPPAEQTAAPPYNSAEPQKYQAEIWQTRGNVTDKYFIVTDGTNWRVDSAYGEPNQVGTLRTDKEYVIAVAEKAYAETPLMHGYETKREDLVREISYGLFDPEKPASYQKLNSANGQITYKVIPDPKEGNESIVTFDEKLGIPVKKEIYAGTAGTGSPTLTITINNLNTNIDTALLDIPKDFKKVPIQDMKSVLTGKK